MLMFTVQLKVGRDFSNKVYHIIYLINNPNTYLSSNIEWETSSFNRNNHE